MVAEFNETIPSGGTVDLSAPERATLAGRNALCGPPVDEGLVHQPRQRILCGHSARRHVLRFPILPAGVELEFRVWQEKIGPITKVTLNGQPANWSKGKMTVKLEPDSELDMDVVLRTRCCRRYSRFTDFGVRSGVWSDTAI